MHWTKKEESPFRDSDFQRILSEVRKRRGGGYLGGAIITGGSVSTSTIECSFKGTGSAKLRVREGDKELFILSQTGDISVLIEILNNLFKQHR